MKFADKGLRAVLTLLCYVIVIFAFKGCANSPDSSESLRTEAYSVDGRWSIDTDASAVYARQSPKWTEEDEANAGVVLDMMSERYFLSFEPDAITIEERGNRVEIPAALIESSGGRRVYRGAFSGVEVEFTATVNDDGNLNLRTSLSEDFDYILWKRAD